jgi:hypothetical protein
MEERLLIKYISNGIRANPFTRRRPSTLLSVRPKALQVSLEVLIFHQFEEDKMRLTSRDNAEQLNHVLGFERLHSVGLLQKLNALAVRSPIPDSLYGAVDRSFLGVVVDSAVNLAESASTQLFADSNTASLHFPFVGFVQLALQKRRPPI